MTWRPWSPVGSTSSSNASFERSFSSDAASALTKRSSGNATDRGVSLARETEARRSLQPLLLRREETHRPEFARGG